MAVEKWLQSLEKIFRVMRCAEEDKVVLATYKLVGEAEHWWDGHHRRFEATQVQPTWGQF